ncbi:MAG: RICIN domain-containing protein [Protaetiibacter sp.]
MSIRTLGRSAKLAVAAGIVAFSVLAGTGASWAYWTSQATSATTLSAASLAVTSTGFATATLGNESVTAAGSSSLASTGSVTFTNTTTTSSSQSATLTVTFSRASGDTTLAGAATLTVWPVASAAVCTSTATATGASSATWSAGVTVSTSLAAGASVVYCLRTTVADRQSIAATGGVLSFTPQAAATLAIGNFSAATTPTGTVQSQYIYPLQQISFGVWWYITRESTTWCWDVSGAATTSGSLLISYACKNTTDANQDFRYLDSDGDGYGNFQPRHATGLRVAAAASTTSGSAVDLRTADDTAAVQQWQPQLLSGSGSSGTYQFVSKYSGLCLSAPATSAGVMTQVTCTGAADQRFTLTQRSVVQLTSVACTNTGSTTSRSVTFSWTSDWNGGGYTVQARQSSSSSWQTIATASAASATSASVSAPISTPLTTWGGTTSGTTYEVQILNSTGSAVGTDTITVTRSSSGSSYYYYARC